MPSAVDVQEIAARAAAVKETAQSQVRGRLALVLMVASGFAGLGYQIVWTQQSALWLGHESAAVLAVVAAFFAGLAAGAMLLSSRIERSLHPARWYAACEATIGLWSLALTLLLTPVTRWFVELIGPQPAPLWHWSIAFGGTFVLLLPATVAMGASLPAMERVVAALRKQGSSISALYAANTCGAVVGVLATAFVLVPRFGLLRTTGLCAGLNLLCAAVAMRLPAAAPTDASTVAAVARRPIGILLAVTGLLGIGYEVLVVRVVSQVAENTVYTFAMLLAVYLIGTTLGASMYQRLARVLPDPERLQDRLLQLLAASCLLGLLCLAHAASLQAAVGQFLGRTMVAALTAEATLAAAAFVLPTFMMGALFSHLAITARTAGMSFGRALAFNTLGAAIAPLLFGVLLLPALGSKAALLLVIAGYLVLASRRAWRTPSQWIVTGTAAALAAGLPVLAIIDIPVGGRLVSHVEGVQATVSIVEDAHGVARLHINNRQQEGSSATLLADARQALLPILLHPQPRRALFLGLGTGVTATSAAQDSTLQVDAVELLPEVVDAAAHFTRMLDTNPTRLHVMSADARRYVRASHELYDVIVADNFHPARSGSGSLYTVEHFAAVQKRLTNGGLFCQWLPLHQLDLETLRSIVRTFLAVYPQGSALLATHSLDTPVLGLVSRKSGERFDAAELRSRLATVSLPQGPASFGIPDELALLGSFIAGPPALAQFAGNAPLNTDDRTVVAYSAPRITYVADSQPRDRLIRLLHNVSITPQVLLSDSTSAALALRLSAYLAARTRFIEAGRDVRPSNDVRRMLDQVREPLLAVLRISPEFRPAYDPLLQMAIALEDIDRAAARALLNDLQQVQPLRPEAGQRLRD